METAVYNQEGKKVGTYALPADVFGLPWNADMVHQVVHSMKLSARDPIAHTKTRAEVSGGGKKPWQQKGLGRARHGSTRSPIWVKGGVAHGPRNDRNYDRKVNKKMRAKALNTILSQKHTEGEIGFVDTLSIKEGKTKNAVSIIKSLGAQWARLTSKRSNAAIIALDKKDVSLERAFRNIGKVTVVEARNLNPVDVLNYAYVIFVNPETSVKTLIGKF
jgi:large subunit ribosomal protein L4